MGREAKFYIVGVAVIASVLAGTSIAGGLPRLSLSEWLGWLCFVGIGMFAERLAIHFGTNRQARSSIAFIPFLAAATIFPPALAMAMAAVTVYVSTAFFSRQEALKVLFNTSQGVLAVGVGAMIFSSFARGMASTGASDLAVGVAAFPALAIAFFGANILLSSMALSLLRNVSVTAVLAQVVGPRGANLWYDLLASPIAVVLAVLYRDYHVLGIVIVVLPLLLIRYSYLSKLQLEETNRDLLTVLVKAIETRDPYTSGHSVRVATLARAIAIDLGEAQNVVEQIEQAALLHDIGKIDLIYEGVIRKPHQLSDEERALIRTHATKGADLLEGLSSLNPNVIRGVRHHHERYDGAGYPDGLAGETIPLSSRIIMLCDSVDAMLSDRPYRRALPLHAVRSELLRCAGEQFDPVLVQVVLTKGTIERVIDEPLHDSLEARRSAPSLAAAPT